MGPIGRGTGGAKVRLATMVIRLPVIPLENKRSLFRKIFSRIQRAALPPKPDIKLESGKWSANDPKRTSLAARH